MPANGKLQTAKIAKEKPLRALRKPTTSSWGACSTRSFHEHAVPVRIEAVALCNRVVISAEDVFCSAQGADQHQQSGLRQVEVRQESIDDQELVSGIDEQVGIALCRCNFF